MNIILQAVNINEVRNNLQEVISLIGEEKVSQCERIVQESDRLLAYGARYLETINFGNKSIKKDNHGKPYLDEGPYFSISHSGEFALIGIYDHPIGADVEKIREFPKKVKESCFMNEYEDDESYFKAWCIKESLLKCIGTGLSGGIKEAPENEGLINYQGKTYFSSLINSMGHIFAVVTEGFTPIVPKLEIISF